MLLHWTVNWVLISYDISLLYSHEQTTADRRVLAPARLRPGAAHLFPVNVTHFQAVQHISALDDPLVAVHDLEAPGPDSSCWQVRHDSPWRPAG